MIFHLEKLAITCADARSPDLDNDTNNTAAVSSETIEECDVKSAKALDRNLKKKEMRYIPLPIKLVHSDIGLR